MLETSVDTLDLSSVSENGIQSVLHDRGGTEWNITITMQRSHLIHTVNIKIKNKTKPTTKKTRKTIIQFRGPNLPKANIIWF